MKFKRLLAFLLAASAVLGFVGCNDNAATNEQAFRTEAPNVETTERVAASATPESEPVTPGPDSGPIEMPTDNAMEELTEMPDETQAHSEEPTEPRTAAAEETAAPAETPDQMEPADEMTRDHLQSINTFLSSFSELYFEDYDGDVQGNEYGLLSFAFWHIYNRDYSKVTCENGLYSIARKDIDECTGRLFGVTVAPGDYSAPNSFGWTNCAYWDDAYHYDAQDGEVICIVSIVNRIERTPSNTYTVWFDVYQLDIEECWDGVPSSYYLMTHEEAAASSSMTYCYSGAAELRDYQNGGEATYRLMRYDRYDK